MNPKGIRKSKEPQKENIFLSNGPSTMAPYLQQWPTILGILVIKEVHSRTGRLRDLKWMPCIKLKRIATGISLKQAGTTSLVKSKIITFLNQCINSALADLIRRSKSQRKRREAFIAPGSLSTFSEGFAERIPKLWGVVNFSATHSVLITQSKPVMVNLLKKSRKA